MWSCVRLVCISDFNYPAIDCVNDALSSSLSSALFEKTRDLFAPSKLDYVFTRPYFGIFVG